MHNCKNYTDQGGSATHIGGELVFENGGSIRGLPDDSTATTVAALKDDFNALLSVLRGEYVEPEPEEPETDPDGDGGDDGDGSDDGDGGGGA